MPGTVVPVRIAVQLFGHLRTFDQCAVSLRRHLLDAYPAHDVFLHTWDRLDHATTTHHAFSCGQAPVDDRTLDRVHSLYAPAALQVDRQVPAEEGELHFANGKRMAIAGIRHMLVSMHRANALRERYAASTGAVYDIVVATRPDVALHRRLDLEAYFAQSRPPVVPEDETLSTRYCAFGPVPRIVNDLRGVPATDLLFFGRPEVMTRALRLSEVMDRYDLRSVVAPSRPQNLLNTYSLDEGIRVALIDYVRPADFDIVRPAPGPAS